jgi:hypothetical protein
MAKTGGSLVEGSKYSIGRTKAILIIVTSLVYLVLGTQSIYDLLLRSTDGDPISYTAGQHI